jgi:hypothetical protein
MAKGILEFNLPEEHTEHEMACRAADMYRVLCDLDNELRNHLKHNSHPEWNGETVEDIRRILNDLMSDYCIRFN